jgi:hypothetical protein
MRNPFPSLFESSLQFLKTGLTSQETQYKFFRLLLAALLVRFLIMPFFCHLDFLSEYRRIHFQLIEGNFFPGSRFIVTIVETINLIIALPFIPNAASMFHMNSAAEVTAGHQDFFAFVSHPGIFQTLFLLKLGYLAFDLATGWLIFKYFTGSKRALLASAVWFFNPVTIFSFYIFGRYEAIALFFLVLSFYLFKEKKLLWSSVAFGLCLWSREIFVLILPLFAIALIISKEATILKKASGLGFIFVILLAVLNFLPAALGFRSVLESAYASMASQGQVHQIIAFNIKWYYPLITIYTLLGFYLITASSDLHSRLTHSILGFFLAFFIFSIHSVHYVAWLFPVLCLAIPHSRFLVLGTIGFCLSWIAYWMVATDLGVFTQWLAAPVSTHLLNLPNFPIWLNSLLTDHTSLQVGHLVSIFKSINAGCLIFIAFQVFRSQTPGISANEVK